MNEARAFRGGSWYYDTRLCRASDRIRITPDFRYYYLGFRVVLSSPQDRFLAAADQCSAFLRTEPSCVASARGI
jgi:hypothetical protein